MKRTVIILTGLLTALTRGEAAESSKPIASADPVMAEENGTIAVEAEHFYNLRSGSLFLSPVL